MDAFILNTYYLALDTKAYLLILRIRFTFTTTNTFSYNLKIIMINLWDFKNNVHLGCPKTYGIVKMPHVFAIDLKQLIHTKKQFIL